MAGSQTRAAAAAKWQCALPIRPIACPQPRPRPRACSPAGMISGAPRPRCILRARRPHPKLRPRRARLPAPPRLQRRHQARDRPRRRLQRRWRAAVPMGSTVAAAVGCWSGCARGV
eukprot:6086649-Prymnesium_polylepis.2